MPALLWLYLIALVSYATAQRDAERPIGPDQQHEGEAIHRFALLTGVHPGEALNGRRQGLRNDRILDDQIAPLPDE